MDERLKNIISEFEEKTGNKVVYVTKSGSKLYGTDTEKSDTDYKGIFIPTKKSVLLKQDVDNYTKDTNNSKEKNSAEDVDFSIHSIYAFFNQLSKSETGAVDVLFSMFKEDSIAFQEKEFTTLIKENYEIFLNRNMKSFIGYALGQTKKFGIKGARYDELDSFYNEMKKDLEYFSEDKLETKFPLFENYIKNNNTKYIKMVEANGPKSNGIYKMEPYISVLGKLFHGRVTVEYFLERIEKLYNQFGNRTKSIAETKTKTDYKALSHSLRIALEVEELLETGFIKFPLKDADKIREIKMGNAVFEDVVEEVQDVLAHVDELLLNSDLPEESNRTKMNEIILELLG